MINLNCGQLDDKVYTMPEHFEAISRAVESGDDKQVIQLVREALRNGVPAVEILEKGLVLGIQALGKLPQ